MNRKVNGLLGMAMRARKLSMGDAIIEEIRKKKAKLVVIAEDASENTKKKITDKCHYYGVDYVYMNGDELNQAIGEYNRAAVAVMEEGFAKSINTCLKG